jgi:NAD+ kinase
MQNIALTVRHSLSGELKGYFFEILQVLAEAKKNIFLCPLAKKLVIKSPTFSHLAKIPEISEIFEEKKEQLDLFVFFGGDGTLLRTVNKYAPEIFDIPLFGINAGNLGFFSSTTPKNIQAAFTEIFSGNFSRDERMVLSGRIFSGEDEKNPEKNEENKRENNKKNKSFYALNECVIHHNKIARLRKISAKISGENLTTYKADGLIIATPTGSTAYNLAGGGPIVAVQMDGFVLTPLAPSGFSQRPIVIPPQKILEFSVDGDMLLSFDGQEYFAIHETDTISIQKHQKKLCFLRLPGESYYTNIREKLGWG